MSGYIVIRPFALHLPLSLQPTLSLLLFLCPDPIILSQHYDALLYISHPSFPHFLLLFFSPQVLCPVTLCPPLLNALMPLSFSNRLPSFSNLHHSVCSHVCYLFSAPNHFAPLMFKGAATLTGDMEVHLPRQEQPGGTSGIHQLHARVSRVGFKTTAKRDYLSL